jgi:hypothetical protein
MANDSGDYTAATKESVARLFIHNPSSNAVAVAVYAEPGNALPGPDGRVRSYNTAIFVDTYTTPPNTAKLAAHCTAFAAATSDTASPLRADLDLAAFLPASEWSKGHVEQPALVIPAGGSVVLLAGSYHSGYYDGGTVRFRLRTVAP